MTDPSSSAFQQKKQQVEQQVIPFSAYCKTHHVKFEPGNYQKFKKRVNAENVAQFLENMTWFPENVTRFPKIVNRLQKCDIVYPNLLKVSQ